jgi:peptide/nickel transport system substrate-binding protein
VGEEEAWWGIDVLARPPRRSALGNNVALDGHQGEPIRATLPPGVADLSTRGYVSTFFADAPYMLSANTAVLFLNTTKSPMDDPAFRRALAFAINTGDIVNVAYANLVRAANPTGLLPSLSNFVDQDVVDRLGFSYDPAESRSILAAAGYVDVDGDGFVEAPDGSAIALEVTCPFGWTDWMEAISVIANSAQEAGINIQAATPDYGAWNTALQTGTFDMTLNNWASMSNTPWTLYNLLFRHPIQEQMQSGTSAGTTTRDSIWSTPRPSASTDVAGMQAACS